MKLIAIFSIFFAIGKTHAQVDTVRNYYQKGQIRSEHPRLNGEVTGPVKYYFLSGSLESELIFKLDKTIHKVYYENGVIRSLVITQNNQYLVIKLYNSEGNIIKSERKIRNGKKTKTWYDNKKLASFEKYSNGEPIICLIYPNDSAKPICYCGNKPVRWKNNTYQLSDGKIANNKFKYKSYSYFENGKRKSKSIERRKSLRKRVWDESGNLIVDKKVYSEVEPIIINSDNDNSSIKKNGGEGWPILKTKNPLRDTTIQLNYITTINDSMIQYSFIINMYDSLGQNNSSSLDGYAKININPDDEKINPYLKEYMFYLSGNKDEFYMAIGINKTDAYSLIIIAGSFYKDLVLNKKLRIHN